MSEPPQDKQPEPLQIGGKASQRGRLGLMIPWQNVPWWGVIILIVGVIVAYSTLTDSRYIDAITFIFDLPWNRESVSRSTVEEGGDWRIAIQDPMPPGEYKLFVESFDPINDPMSRSEFVYLIITEDAVPEPIDPIQMEGQHLTLETSTPAFVGKSPGANRVVLFDDFSHQPFRILKTMFLSRGVFLTIRVTLISFVAALILGLLFGLMRTSSPSPDLGQNLGWRTLIGLGAVLLLLAISPEWRRWPTVLIVLVVVEAFAILLPAMPYTISTLYVEIIRGIPMLVIVLYMGFAVTPALRTASAGWGFGEIDLRGIPAAVIGLAVGYGAYLAEVYRAGIQSIPRGQVEAARSLGMNYLQAMRYVILPQAIRLILPPLGNDFIALLKDSSLISVIALPEILQQGRLWVSRNFRAFEGYNSVALMYLVMTLMLSLVVRMIERRTSLE
ncbi:MAG: amino acid ABC transporter permease [Anaerolineales bacterium]